MAEMGKVLDEYVTCTLIMNGCCASKLGVLTAELVDGGAALGLLRDWLKSLRSEL